jgi:hypothetical protein
VPKRSSSIWRTVAGIAVLSAAVLATVLAAQAGRPRTRAVPDERVSLDDTAGEEVVAVDVPSGEDIERLRAAGFGLLRRPYPQANGSLRVELLATPAGRVRLAALGYPVVDTLLGADHAVAVRQERADTLGRIAAAEALAVDTLDVLHSDWFVGPDGATYLNLEVHSDAGDSATTQLTATWNGRSAALIRFVDAGFYLAHRLRQPVDLATIPSEVTITSTAGGSVTTPVTQWLGEPLKPQGLDYQTGFVDHYVDATEATVKIEALAAEFPELAEIVELPYPSNGYRRKGMATLGTLASRSVVVTSHAWGHEGGNGITVELRNPALPSAPLSVSVAGQAIAVSLATDAAGALTSTAVQVVDALNADAAALIAANTYRGNAGAGIAEATAGPVTLSDFLAAPASVSREPFPIKAIRIGYTRGGSKTGALIVAGHHGNEWVGPLVALETAERLLRNAASDGQTRKLLRDLDVFIVPVANPDGLHYAINGYAAQRKNMTNYCGPAANDLGRRNLWGVNPARNFSVGSLFDGYAGASSDCTDLNYAGPAELSEPESRNEVWLTQTFANIRFYLGVHSYGGYFLWPPDSYTLPERETLPRLPQAMTDFSWAAASTFLSRVQEHRGTAIWPSRTGDADVWNFYAASGTPGDEHWYNRGIHSFLVEVGAPKPFRDDEGTLLGWIEGFHAPDFSEEGYDEAQEFAGGAIGFLEVARAFGRDTTAPQSTLVPAGAGFSFETSEPAAVHYTIDGSRPSYQSPRLGSAGSRAGPETIPLPPGSTVVRWFSVDPGGNVEGRYEPNGTGTNYREQVVTVE